MSGLSSRATRLTDEDVAKFLSQAREAFMRSGFIVGSLKHTIPDFQILNLVTSEDHQETIHAVLNELEVTQYNGPHPPDHISGEPKCKGARMLQFVWNSACFENKLMYIKLCMVNGRLAVLRIHEDCNPNKFKD